MAKKKVFVKLDCGVEAESWFYSGNENLEISLLGLYDGYGELSDLKTLGALFTELSEKGFKNEGLSRVEGYYGSTDDLILRVSK